MKRREFIKTSAAAGAALGLAPTLMSWVPQHNWHNYDFGPGPKVTDRLYQGPIPSYAPEDYFGEEPMVIQYTMPGKQLLNNPRNNKVWRNTASHTQKGKEYTDNVLPLFTSCEIKNPADKTTVRRLKTR